MLGRSGYSRAVAANVGEIERRVRSLEQRVQRVGGRATASAAQTADHVGETIASALSSMADRFAGGANSMGIDTAKLGGEAARLGNDALRRLSKEVERRPLVLGDEPLIPVAESEDLPDPVVVAEFQDQGPDHVVEAGTQPAAGDDARLRLRRIEVDPAARAAGLEAR